MVRETCRLFDSAKLRKTILDIKKKNEIIIDETSIDELIQAGFDEQAEAKSKETIDSFKKFLDKKGQGLHHMALDTDNIEGEVERMEGCGIQFLGKIGPGSAGTKVTFIHPKSLDGVLTELCSHPK